MNFVKPLATALVLSTSAASAESPSIHEQFQQITDEVVSKVEARMPGCSYLFIGGRRSTEGPEPRYVDLKINSIGCEDTSFETNIEAFEAQLNQLKAIMGPAFINVLMAIDDQLGNETCFQIKAERQNNPYDYRESKRFRILECLKWEAPSVGREL